MDFDVRDEIKNAVARLTLETDDKNPWIARVHEWDNKSIIEMFVLKSAHSWDAMIRIEGLPDNVKGAISKGSFKMVKGESFVVRSLFSFNFRLGPWDGCLNLNFANVKLAPDFAAVCTRDHLGIIWEGDPAQNDTARTKAHALARALIHADAFFSFPDGIVLEVEPVTWLELRDCKPTKVVSGYMHQSLTTTPLDSQHPDKLRICKGAALVCALGNVPALHLALSDFYAARREVGSYSAFYAYRVLEDIGSHFGVTKDGHPDWNAMNAALRTSKGTWKQLTEAGTIARHLNNQTRAKLHAMNRMDLLRLSFQALDLALKKLGVL